MEKKFKKELKNSKGFTLIELLVVIAIIGLLATMSVVALSSAREKARDSRRLSDVKQIQTALEMYYSSVGEYPATLDTNGGGEIATSSQVYMAEIPQNPTPVTDGACETGVGNYGYAVDTNRANYVITYCVGSQTNDISAGTNCATPAGIAATSTNASGVCAVDGNSATYQ
ncbi:prepilin-type N-terminal cleavage/methylation domain-containing protein [bacterium]|nr:prepilin-type N-terminal cleavage/methylation domain-containing protein [bacterium]